MSKNTQHNHNRNQHDSVDTDECSLVWLARAKHDQTLDLNVSDYPKCSSHFLLAYLIGEGKKNLKERGGSTRLETILF